jgi:hypothetical protein
MARETEKLLTTRADAAKAALAATVAARDANIAREILERGLADLTVLTDAVETVNHGLAALSQRLADRPMDEGRAVSRKKLWSSRSPRVDALEKAAVKSSKKR